MVDRRTVRKTLTAPLMAGAFIAIPGALVLTYYSLVWMEAPNLTDLLWSYGILMTGFLIYGILTLFVATIKRLGRVTTESASSGPDFPLPPEAGKGMEDGRSSETEQLTLSELTRQVRTYIDLEMWELAYNTAREILSRFPSAPIAGTLSRNLNELRWKAEPKFVDQDRAPTENTRKEERDRVQEGLDQAVQQVKTYMELEMWELARQKTHSLMKSFPDSPQSDQLAKWYPEIDRGCREMAEEEAKAADPAPPGEESPQS